MRLIDLAAGVDRSTVTPDTPHKSISSERTLARDTRDKALLKTCLLQQAEEIARQLRKAGVKASTLTLKLKHSDFRRISRSKTIAVPTRSSETIYRHATRLLIEYPLPGKIRLIGLGTSGFKPGRIPVQLELFDRQIQDDGSWSKIDRTLETITRKFGKEAIKRASLSEE